MSGQRAFVAMVVVAVLMALGGASWLSQQEVSKAPQPNPQVLLEKEYWRRVHPILDRERERDTVPGGVWQWALESRLEHGSHDASIELLFAARRCGLVSKKEFALKFKRMHAAVTAQLKRDARWNVGPYLRRERRRLVWFSVFGKADLNTPVGLPPTR